MPVLVPVLVLAVLLRVLRLLCLVLLVLLVPLPLQPLAPCERCVVGWYSLSRVVIVSTVVALVWHLTLHSSPAPPPSLLRGRVCAALRVSHVLLQAQHRVQEQARGVPALQAHVLPAQPACPQAPRCPRPGPHHHSPEAACSAGAGSYPGASARCVSLACNRCGTNCHAFAPLLPLHCPISLADRGSLVVYDVLLFTHDSTRQHNVELPSFHPAPPPSCAPWLVERLWPVFVWLTF